jgi:tetratricopeptide (TPR) repeat protein
MKTAASPSQSITGRRATRRAFRVSCALLALASVTPALAAGEQSTQAPVQQVRAATLAVPAGTRESFKQLPAGKRLKILVALIRDGQPDAAESLLRAKPFDGQYGHNRNLFIIGMIARARGQLDQAARVYRTVLAADPNLTMVRLELAATLHAMDQTDGAKHHLNLLKSAAPTPDLARNFGDFIAAIDAQRPWSFNAWISLAPSTNFNNGTALEYHTLFGLTGTVGELAKQKSGIGIKGGSNAAYVFDLGGDLQAIVATGTYFEQYDGKLFDKTALNQNIELRRNHARGSIGIGMSASQSFYKTNGTGGFPYANETAWSFGPQITIRHLLTRHLNIETRLSHRWNRFNVAEWSDGTSTSLTNRLAYTMSTSRVLYAMGGGDRNKTGYDHTSTWAGWGGLGIYQEVPWGITVYAEGKLRYSVSDGDYLFLGEPRENTRVDGRMVLTKRDFSFYGLAPQLEYTYTRNWSNDELSKFESHGLAVTLTRAF